VWRPHPPFVNRVHATMLFYIALFFFIAILMLTLLGKLCSVEATDRSGAALVLSGGDIRLFDTVAATFRGGIKIHLSGGVDTSISIPSDVHRLADTCHPPLAQGWGETVEAALSSTKAVIHHFKLSTDPDEVTPLFAFIQCITLLTFLRLFLRLPITPANVQEVAWIVGKAGSHSHDFIEDPAELRPLLKSSQNPSGILAVLSATQRLVLSAVCLLEHRKDNIGFLRQAKVLLENPTSFGSDVTRRVEKIIRSYPPVQSIHGKLSLGWLPLRQTDDVDFFIAIDALPQSDCLMGPNGACASWLHKAALPGQPGCDGMAWFTHTTAIILSAIETEIRQANLTIDKGGDDPDAWEDWVLRRLRVG